ncbi:MAG: 4Fe-4S binding protein [Gemmatimonadota bacterium]|nr:MAG: 4Fe-4S binding protein [Gemmatimonadota bacterium]
MSNDKDKIKKQDVLLGIKHGRTLSQILFLGLTVWVAYRMLSGVRGATIEKYCPFGGVETLFPWLNKTGTLCSLSTMNISVLAGVLLITLLYKRAFCSHICPVGALSEWIALIGRRYIIKSRRVPSKVDRPLKWLKYPVLALIVWGTVRVGELIFREVDPYYVLFTLGRGHGIAEGVIGIGGYSLVIILILFGLNVVLPLAFCKYLCPMAACLNPLSRIGLIRVRRNPDTCIDCRRCDVTCQWGVKVSDVGSVGSAECSNCQDCVRSCPVPDTLTLSFGRSRS